VSKKGKVVERVNMKHNEEVTIPEVSSLDGSSCWLSETPGQKLVWDRCPFQGSKEW
jgi:hypothetical protein